MKPNQVTPLPLLNQIVYSSGSIAFNMMERMILLYAAFYYLPPREYGLAELFPAKTYYGFFTIFGLAVVLGRVFDAVSDPVVAALSDNSKARVGRRKIFMLISGAPLALTAALIFSPPYNGIENVANGVWLGVMMALFYVFFTGYANPFLALVSELGLNQSIRINLSTFIAALGLVGVALVTVAFPLITARLQAGGMDIRASYQWSAFFFAAIACVIAYLSTLGFKEKKHCLPSEPVNMGVLESLKKTYAVKHFITFLSGELFMMFCVNIITLGLMYYAVVIFKREQEFMTVIAGAALGGSMICFPLVNMLAKKYGKKKIMLIAVAVLSAATFAFFLLSFNMSGLFFYLGLAVLVVCGFPLAALSTLLYSTTADIAREDALRTGVKREAMFYGARALPLKLVIALSGLVFGFLISTFGKDIANPLGVQLSLLVVSVVSLFGLYCFYRYPEEKVLESLHFHEARLLQQQDSGKAAGSLDIDTAN